jgi:hypothetical protein
MLARILLLGAAILAAYQIIVGIDHLDTVPIYAYTCAFGILLVAELLIIILGFDVLDSPVVVIISTLIPLSLSLGLVWQYLPTWRLPYLIFVLVGFAAVITTRIRSISGKLPITILALVHGVAGLIIFWLPISLALKRAVSPGFVLVGAGGALISLGGMLFLFAISKPEISRKRINKILPVLLLIVTAAFVGGFAFS